MATSSPLCAEEAVMSSPPRGSEAAMSTARHLTRLAQELVEIVSSGGKVLISLWQLTWLLSQHDIPEDLLKAAADLVAPRDPKTFEARLVVGMGRSLAAVSPSDAPGTEGGMPPPIRCAHVPLVWCTPCSPIVLRVMCSLPVAHRKFAPTGR